MLIAEFEEKTIGFTLLIDNSIDLIALDPQYVGQGIATTMIAFANKHHGPLTAGTQITNQASIGLYQKTNFGLDKSFYVLHRI